MTGDRTDDAADADGTWESRFARRPKSRADGGAPDAPGSLQGPGPEHRPRPKGRRTDHGVRVDPEAASEHPPRKALISAVVDHEPGVLAEVSGLFSRRQFNIESLTVGPTADEEYARITLVVEEPNPGVDQVKKQLRTLLCVREVNELEDSAIEREMALIEVEGDRPDQVRAAVEMYDGEVVDATPDTITLEVTGPARTVDDAIDTFAQFGLREIARTGATALARGETPTTEWPRHVDHGDGDGDEAEDDHDRTEVSDDE